MRFNSCRDGDCSVPANTVTPSKASRSACPRRRPSADVQHARIQRGDRPHHRVAIGHAVLDDREIGRSIVECGKRRFTVDDARARCQTHARVHRLAGAREQRGDVLVGLRGAADDAQRVRRICCNRREGSARTSSPAPKRPSRVVKTGIRALPSLHALAQLRDHLVGRVDANEAEPRKLEIDDDIDR